MNNKTQFLVPLLALCLLSVFSRSSRLWAKTAESTPLFAENKGQLKDQFRKQRTDIRYYGSSDGMSYYFKQGGVSYQLYQPGNDGDVSVSRVDMEWGGANPSAKMETENKSVYTENFYTGERDGITGVRHFGDLRYKALYQGIDLHYYYKNGSLKYDFEVAAGADYKKIKIRFAGATTVKLEEDGSMTITTPNGSIKEARPVAYQGGKEIASAWVVKDKVLSFDLSNYNSSLPVVIDPLVFQWKKKIETPAVQTSFYVYASALAFGDFDKMYYSYTRDLGPIPATLELAKNSRSTGEEALSWRKTIQGGLSGPRDVGTAGCSFRNNYIYMAGYTTNGAGIATTGAYQTTFNPGFDCFIVKYDTSGTKVWGTYYGGTGNDSATACKTDADGNTYICGLTRSATVMASMGAYRATLGGQADAFIAKFDNNGIRVWGTYYGGSNADAARGLDLLGNRLFVAGTTRSTNDIALLASQPALSGSDNAFLLCMDTTGTPQWCTYYGADSTVAWNCATGSGYVYLTGGTTATTNIATPGTHQSVKAGGVDAFLAKFDLNGIRQWGTYVGGAGNDVAMSNAVGLDGHVFICGSTLSDTGISTPLSYSTVYSANPNLASAGEAYIVEFDSTGQRVSGTYITDGCVATEIAIASNGDVAVIGEYRDLYNDWTGFRAKFAYCNTPKPVITASNPVYCQGPPNTPVTLSTAVVPGVTYQWYRNGAPTGSNTNQLTINQEGAYQVILSGCSTGISDIVSISRVFTHHLQVAHTDIPCYNNGAAAGAVTLTATGGLPPYSYAWDGLPDTTAYVSGLPAGTYVVHTKDNNGCIRDTSVTIHQDTAMLPSDPLASICAVTVDSDTGKNSIVWEKTGTVKAVSYKVYRETSVSGQYELLGSVPVTDPGIFLDNTGNPLQQSYSYKIAEMDSCDHEWPMSSLHKTIHLSANVGTGGELNLSWNAYEGMSYATHFIERSNNGGDYVLLNQVSATTLSYSDLTPPPGNNKYRIYIDIPTACQVAAGLTFSRAASNIVTLGDPTGIDDPLLSAGTRIVPNPTKGKLTVTGRIPARITVSDLSGKILLNQQYSHKLDIGGLAKGVYVISLFNREGYRYYSQRVVLE